jgi:hypothetical protein
MALNRNYVLNALLRANYFPNQKSDPTELPSVISTESFTADVANQLKSGDVRSIPGYRGYDAVEFQVSRFDGRSRTLSIPHPMAHANLSLCIYEHWSQIDYITHNRNSKIRPKEHRDNRLIVMDYDDWKGKARSQLNKALMRNYVVRADVAQCYSSIYSHAIAWATVGMTKAKQSVGKKQSHEWFNQLDQNVMLQKRNETSGLLVGPATSNIVVEVILARVDEELRNSFTFERYIDDYSAYVDTVEESEAFLRALGKELRRYKLALNESKSELRSLPIPLKDKSIADLSNLLPKSGPIGAYEAISYLDFAVAVSKENPKVSAIKHGVKALLAKGIAAGAISDVLLYCLTLAFRQPGLLPLFEAVPKKNLVNFFSTHENDLNRMIQNHSRSGMADGVEWALHYLKKSGGQVSDDSAKEILLSRDCISIMLLFHIGSQDHVEQAVAFAKSVAQQNPYTLDQYWLLLFETFREGRMGNPYRRFREGHAFATMKEMGVHFMNF